MLRYSQLLHLLEDVGGQNGKGQKRKEKREKDRKVDKRKGYKKESAHRKSKLPV